MENEESPFIMIYDRMFDLDLPVKELLVYALIHGFNRDGWECFGIKKSIAERLRMQPSGVSRALSDLKRRGLVLETFWVEGGSTLFAKFDDTGPYIKVYDWMLSLRLPGRELLAFSLIYGFSRNGKVCFGRREWIGKRLHISNPGKVISSLKKRGLIRETYKPDDSPVLVVTGQSGQKLHNLSN